MGDVKVYHILAITHGVLCLVSYAHSINNSDATGA